MYIDLQYVLTHENTVNENMYLNCVWVRCFVFHEFHLNVDILEKYSKKKKKSQLGTFSHKVDELYCWPIFPL